MKHFWLLLFSLLPIMGLAQDVKVKLSGEINFPDYDKSSRIIYFVYQQNGKSIIDSTLVKNNAFAFSTNLNQNVKVKLQFTKPGTSPNAIADPNILNLFVSGGAVKVKASGYLGRAQVAGSAMHDEYVAFKKTYLKIDTSLRLLGWKKKRVKATDTLKMKAVDEEIDSVRNAKMNRLASFLDQHIGKPYAAEAILMYLRASGSTLNLGKAQQYFDNLPEAQKQSAEGNDITKEIASINAKLKTKP
mgnify:CR=1 FL=1